MIRHPGASLVAVALWLAPISVGATVKDFSGDDYIRYCTTTHPDQRPQNTEEQEMAVFCACYTAGAITAIAATSGQSLCVPGSATPQDVLKATVAFMQAHPDQKKNLFASVILAAVLDQWPCQSK